MEEITEKRDNLAKQRTHLANERSLLYYIRTFLALAAFGILLIKYENTDISAIIGILLIIIAVILLTF